MLQYQPQDKNNRIPLMVTYSPNLEYLRYIINDLQAVLQKDNQFKIA